MQNYLKSGSEKTHEVIGVMSGTSVDGLDLVCCRFEKKEGRWSYNIVSAESITYPEKLYGKLLDIISLPAESIFSIDIEFGEFIGNQINRFIGVNKLNPDLIASHGHTVFHQPDKRISVQIGSGPVINKITGIITITGFRQLDVILGGQGAPLVPVGDQLLFAGYDVCLNLGGFSNISFERQGARLACDISPVNIVLNRIARSTGKPYDDRGEMARRGKFMEDIFNELNNLQFYSKLPPKSLGLEWVNEKFMPVLNKKGDTGEKLNTATHHIAYQIDHSIRDLLQVGDHKIRVLTTGGGVYNDFLMEVLREAGNDIIVYEKPGNLLIDFKEAIIFAFLGLLRAMGEINTLSSVTGASNDSSGGIIYDNFPLGN